MSDLSPIRNRYEKISYDFTFLDVAFEIKSTQLASLYKRWGRCLVVIDINMKDYFWAHGLELVIHETKIGEKAKTMDTLLGICDAMTDFGIIRKGPVLVLGGGLIIDVAGLGVQHPFWNSTLTHYFWGGFPCATYRRTTNFILIPTTAIGLIDASVSIKVAVNHGKYKNLLGAYHAPLHTFLDFTFLRTLPEAQVRNGFAELVKISTCADYRTFELLDAHCEGLIRLKFGRADGSSEELKSASDTINHRSIHVMLKLETPNLHEVGLLRVIVHGHTWNPTLELAPETPLRHGHAISVDMAYSATLALLKGLITPEDHARILALFSRAGLTVDDPLFDEELLAAGTQAILKTRDGKLRAAIPAPLGECLFLNNVTREEMEVALMMHKETCKSLPRKGAGLDA
ncbi:2-epi-5-epi-valiolone synthase [Choiromyces venosus 120613-1]|uniref:2-epi-5-epi-valiolone synthase n=1 Tax=Choiromyces venosus 120613-1 TaxID=1336337 RepID=A0A3N4K0D0_9PEZI|nr:2-epi-5-epi-valiolone synthase [Choiromyces venosus 120613-1]